MRPAPDVLARIVSVKRQELAQLRASEPLARLRSRAESRRDLRDFAAALRAPIARNRPGVIAEIKKASPSRGVLREAFDPPAIASSFERHGAACLSVLTDRQFFQGELAYLDAVRSSVALPVLRKDFLIDEHQVYEARAAGADCILLIAAILDDPQMHALEDCARELGMGVLIEVHDRDELDRALACRTPLIGINNRDLRDFSVSLQVTLDLASQVGPERTVITESGILEAGDVQRLRAAGIHAFLVGEAFMRAPDPGLALAQLFA